MAKKRSAVVVSDLDVTLLHGGDYSFEEVRPALAALRDRKIPLVLVSSKTRAEMEPLRAALGLADPFVVENGGAAYVPKGYFGKPVSRRDDGCRYEVMSWGTPYAELVIALRRARRLTGACLVGFSDVAAEEVAQLVELPLEHARRAMEREFDEPFWVEGEEDERSADALALLASGNLTVTRGGRFYHLMGSSDKGAAVRNLLALYREAEGQWLSAGLGDAANDLPFLQVVDRAYIVAGLDGRHSPELIQAIAGAQPVGPAPRGWAAAISDFLSWLDEPARGLHNSH